MSQTYLAGFCSLAAFVFSVFTSMPVFAMSCVDLMQEPAALKSFRESGLNPLPMSPEYVGEERPQGVWIYNPQHFFGRDVSVKRVLVKTRYLKNDELQKTVATISKDGRLISQFNNLSFIFVVTLTGELRVWPIYAHQTSLQRLKHSSLSHGEDVLFAGEMHVDVHGRIWQITRRSGHYVPGMAYLNWFIDYLEEYHVSPLSKVKQRDGF